jgi:steroid delta-isomerase-like uncharacterized protein
MESRIDAEPKRRRSMAQSAEDVARESIDCYNAGDFDRLRSLLADDFYEEELATQRRLEGADARIEAAQGWKRAFPDEQGTIAGVYTSGNTVVLELTWKGTHSGPLSTPDGRELPPSNKPVTVKSVQVIEIEGGKMKALRHYFDLMTLLQEIGAMDQAETALASRLHSPASG